MHTFLEEKNCTAITDNIILFNYNQSKNCFLLNAKDEDETNKWVGLWY